MKYPMIFHLGKYPNSFNLSNGKGVFLTKNLLRYSIKRFH